MVTLKEVAKKANVSTATVSYVLNGSPNQVSSDTRKRVLKIVEELNYKPNRIAKSLRTNKSHTIGVVVEDITVFNTPEIINGIGEFAEQHGYNIVLNNLRLYHRVGNHYDDVVKCKEQISNVIESILGRETDGIIYVGAHYRDVTGIIDVQNKPIVYTYCFEDGGNSSWINFDDEKAAYDVTEYLVELGHEKIAVITGTVDSIPSQERLRGFQKAIIDNNLFINPQYIKEGTWEYSSGYAMAKDLLESTSPPTAIFALNDLMAGGVLDATRELGIKVPEDLSLIGFDNRQCSFYYIPKLTTVDIPLNEMGKAAAKALLAVLDNEAVELSNEKLECKIVKRQSAGAPR